MPTKNRKYVVDRDLTARPITTVLRQRGQLPGYRAGVIDGGKGRVGSDRDSVPVSEDGTLRVGKLYPSSTDPSVRFYLPRYRHRVVNGRFTTSLKYRTTGDDPEGPIGWLTVELVPMAPQQPGGFELREIEHDAVVRLGYRMGVDGGGSGSPGALLWIELGAIEHLESDVHRCRREIFAKEEFDRIYQVMTNRSFRGFLEVRCLATIGHRTWKQIVVGGRADGMAQASYLTERKVLFTDTLNAKTLKNANVPAGGAASQKIKLEEDPKEVTIRTDLRAALIRGLSSSARSTLIGAVLPLIRSGALIGGPQSPSGAADSDGGSPTTPPPTPAPTIQPIVISQPHLIHHVATAHLATAPSPTPPQSTASEPQDPQRALRLAAFGPQLARYHAVPLKTFLQSSDMKVTVAGVSKPVVPARAVAASGGRPALLEVEAEARQPVRFFFAPQTNAYMFDMPEDLQPSTNHILLKDDVTVGGQTVTFYQDSAFRDQFYYEPQEFRLSRLPNSPYLPDLVVAFFDVVGEEDEEGTVSIHYRVELAYRALPFIDQHILNAARARYSQAGSTPLFTALDPTSSSLDLRLPLDEVGGDLVSVARSDAEVAFDGGIVDSVELSQTEFERIFAAFQSPSGIGVSGKVEARLFDESQVTIPVELSLKESAGPLFDRSFGGPVEGGPQGRNRVSLRNRIESPVRVEGLHGVPLGADATASPVDAELGATVAPGETLQIDYQVTPPDAAVLDIEPILTTSIETDHALLWRALMVNQGYTSDTFTINVSTDAGFFGPPPQDGVEPLTGLLVEFESDTSVELTATTPEVDVMLRMALLPRLMKEPEAQRYRYRVTNVHMSGAGARTNWLESEGDLQVAPAPLPQA